MLREDKRQLKDNSESGNGAKLHQTCFRSELGLMGNGIDDMAVLA